MSPEPSTRPAAIQGWVGLEAIKRSPGPWRITGRCWGRKVQISSPRYSLVVPVAELSRFGIKV